MVDPTATPRRRLRRHPVVWAVPLLALVATVAWVCNGSFYDTAVNSDPQGDFQLGEWRRTTAIFHHTTGLLYGQLVALIVGAALAARHRWAVALALAGLLSGALAATAFFAGQLLGPLGQADHGDYLPMGDPVFVRMLVRELVAYPLYAFSGVGLGVLIRTWLVARAWPLIVLVAPPWMIGTLVGLFQNGDGDAPHWLYWVAPPIAAATAVSLSALSMVERFGPAATAEPVLLGDWGNEASIALLAGATVYAVVLNLLAVTVVPHRHDPGPLTGQRSRNTQNPRPERSGTG
jgi:hypothetical protein